MTARRLVFCDVESTGLDPARHELWEIAYAVDDGPILSSFVTHKPPIVNSGTRDALRISGYLERFRTIACSEAFEDELADVLTDATLVGANPAFDAYMLRARWDAAPWHHRLLDIEAYAMGAFGWSEMRGLAGVAEHLGVPAPDHTAAGDVATVRACWQAIQAYGEPS